MQMTRRHFGLSLTASSLTACTGAGVMVPGDASGLPSDLKPVPNAGYDAWVASFRTRAARQGISEATLNAGFRGAGYLPGVVTRDRNQTEFKRSLEDYLSITV